MIATFSIFLKDLENCKETPALVGKCIVDRVSHCTIIEQIFILFSNNELNNHNRISKLLFYSNTVPYKYQSKFF